MNSSTSLKKNNRSANGNGNQSDAKLYLTRSVLKDEVTRQTYYVRVDLLEKLRGYAHWERIGISELINQILEEFFEDKEVQPKPPRKRLRYRR